MPHPAARYIRRDPDGCWTWTGPTTRGQQPAWRDKDGRLHRARALFWRDRDGNHPALGGALRAKCRNVLCVNPQHLRYTPPSQARRPNRGDADPYGPPTPGQEARAAATGLDITGLTCGEAADAQVRHELAMWGLLLPHDAAP